MGFCSNEFHIVEEDSQIKELYTSECKIPMFSSSVNALDEKWLALVTCYPNLNFTQEPLGGMYMSP